MINLAGAQPLKVEKNPDPTISKCHRKGPQIALRVALSADGVSISDNSDTLSIKVVDERGTAVFFKQKAEGG